MKENRSQWTEARDKNPVKATAEVTADEDLHCIGTKEGERVGRGGNPPK